MKPTNKDEVGFAPLLPKYQSIEHEGPEGSSVSRAVVFNVSTSMIGAGIMSIPATLKVLGIVPGFIVIGMSLQEISLKGHCTRAFYKNESLGHTSPMSILLAVVFVAVSSAMSAMAVYAIGQGETQQLRLVPDFDNGVSYFELFTTIPVLATGLACHVTSKNDRLGDAI
ncbi:hypothetical protein RJ639_005415 [Escallonia herrerae]|uniref:Amino acid transporter transmembrane domain-containing protein n=1 Tax=Escallonia herrerae TaxID=1293975 RepID=A0AA88VTK4_9ASTE|nr:hypothetical protein RJ639_005415 [Escallonia herrerae]